LSGGEFLIAVAQVLGAQFWTGLDRCRADTAGEALSVVATPASTTEVELVDRFAPGPAGPVSRKASGNSSAE
jgi:hypothetical protein